MATVEDLKAQVGKQGGTSKYLIDKSMVRLYCDAIGDQNPKWKDVAPPGMMTCAMFVGEGVHMDWPYKVIVDAGADWEFLKPFKPGDTLTVVNTLANVEDKSSEKARRLLISFKSTITNQRGEVVAVSVGRCMNSG